MLKAGAAVVEINPQLPCFLAGMGSDRPLARKIHDPICARSLALENEGRRLALCAIDTLGISACDCDAVRARAARELGWAQKQILVAGTHTHNGPPVLRFYEWNTYPKGSPLAEVLSPEQFFKEFDGNASRSYLEMAWRGIAKAVCLAAKAMRPAEVAVGTGEVSLNINRWHARGNERIFIPYARRLDGDSSQDLPANLVCDPETAVLHFREAGGGKTIATWLHWTAHPICVCLRADELSADYPYFAGKALERELGGMFIFTNGAIGDVHPRDFDTGYEKAQSLGSALAQDALRALKGRPFANNPALRLEEEEVFLPYSGVPGGRKSRVAAGRVGDFAFNTWPGEPWVEIGLEAKRRNPFPVKALIGCADDYQGYFALRQTIAGNTYDTLATRPALFGCAAVENMLKAGEGLLRRLKNEA